MTCNENWKNTKRELTLRMLLAELECEKEKIIGSEKYVEDNVFDQGKVAGLNYAIGHIETELGIPYHLNLDKPPKKVKE